MADKTNPPLTDYERNLLLDIRHFNASELARGWQVKGKSLGVAALNGIQLNNAVFENVDLAGVSLEGSRIENTTFKAVSFIDSNLSRALLQNTKFVDCRIELRSSEAGFKRCAFDGCQIGKGTWQRSVLEGCEFQSSFLSGTAFSDAHIQGCRIRNSNLRNTSFSHCRLDDLEISDSGLDSTSFVWAEGSGLAIASSGLENCSFSQCQLPLLNFSTCSMRLVALIGNRISNLKVQGAKEIRRLSLIKCESGHAAFSNCEKAAELYLSETTIPDLVIENCRISFLRAEGCFLSGSWRDSVIHGLNLSRSQSAALSVSRTTFEQHLILNGARFGILVLDGVKYAPGIRVSDEDCQYAGKDRFGP